MMRSPRPCEIYELRCACGGVVELSVAAVIDGVGQCPHCNIQLLIRWREVPL